MENEYESVVNSKTSDEAFCLFCEEPIDTFSEMGAFCQKCYDEAGDGD